MYDLRKVADENPDYPPILFFFQGSIDDGEAFFARLWLEARAVSDTPKTFYKAMGIQRGGMREMFGPQVFACGARASLKGQTIGRPIGDPWIMPGLFLVNSDGGIDWQHDFAHAGDHPDWQLVMSQMAG